MHQLIRRSIANVIRPRHAAYTTTAEAPSTGAVKVLSESKCFGGTVRRIQHYSPATKTNMIMSVFEPPATNKRTSFPALIWLSGLTCNETNFITKAAAQVYASKKGLMLIAPDTSPQLEIGGLNLPGETDSWDFGAGAGFYVDATENPYAQNYNMYSYITKDLVDFAEKNLPLKSRNHIGIFGHSMGGLGALNCALKNPGLFASVSAFAPICHPVNCPWGQKAFSGYLGPDRSKWAAYDPTLLIAQPSTYRMPLFIDQGSSDEFLAKGQLQPEKLEQACHDHQHPLVLRTQPGYDHSYYFISTFIGDHLHHHSLYLM